MHCTLFRKSRNPALRRRNPKINLIKQRLKRAIEIHEAWEKQHG
jgi:hypothetical protein